MTPQSRTAFELLRFGAAPVGDALVVVDLACRFGEGGRFARRPVLVVERPGGNGRLELAPLHVHPDGDRWSATYAVPTAVMDGARFGVVVRGTLVELPEPDHVAAPAGADPRAALLLREADALRREVERLETRSAAAEGHAAEAELRVEEARRQAEEVEERAQAAEERAASAQTRAEVADERAAAAEERVTVLERGVRELEQRVLGAEDETAVAQDQTTAAEERLAAAEARVAAADERAAEAERRAEADASGLAVLRAELAEERERARRAALPLQEPDDEDDADDDEPDPGPALAQRRAREEDRGADVVYAPPSRRAAPRPAPLAVARVRRNAYHHDVGLQRWLAVLALVLLVAVVVVLAFGHG